jgi:Golgi SNAP receptor complex protein 1
MQNWDSLKFKFRESLKRLDEISIESSVILRDQSIESAPQEKFYEICQNFVSQSSECDQTLAQMNRYAKASKSDRTTIQAQVDRFREMLSSSRQQWIRTKTSIQEEFRRRELLDKNTLTNDSSNIHSTLFEERNALVRSLGMVDESINQAFNTNEILRRQSASISGFTEKLANITSHVPGINSILSRINNRQFQEKIIISIVLGACISILIWMRLLR